MGDGKPRRGPLGLPDVTQSAAVQNRQDRFRALIEPEIDVLLRAARTLTGSWPDAEDVVQDTLIRAWGALDRFDGAHPRAWLLTILRNAQRNSVRRRRPEPIGDATDLEGFRPMFTPAEAADPQDVVADAVVDERLQAAVDALGTRFRTALLLVDVHQLGYADVAALLGVPVGTVMSRVSRARSKVRARLRAEQPAPPHSLTRKTVPRRAR